MACVLLVDDNDLVREAMREVLTQMGHRVLEARDSAEARVSLEMATPDLVVMDIFLPEKSAGLSVLNSVRRQKPGTPILAISGGGARGERSVLKSATEMGADATLAKPFPLDQFQTTVESLLDQRQPSAR